LIDPVGDTPFIPSELSDKEWFCRGREKLAVQRISSERDLVLDLLQIARQRPNSALT
jgi:hypothetical protein